MNNLESKVNNIRHKIGKLFLNNNSLKCIGEIHKIRSFEDSYRIVFSTYLPYLRKKYGSVNIIKALAFYAEHKIFEHKLFPKLHRNTEKRDEWYKELSKNKEFMKKFREKRLKKFYI